jgi:uracil-DNA glycosylase
MYDDGKGYVPDLLRDVDTALVAQNPGNDEERGSQIVEYINIGKSRRPLYQTVTPQPLIGATGFSVNDTWLPKAGLKRSDVSLMNIIKCRYRDPVTKKKINKLPPAAILNKAVAHCMEAHFVIPDQTTTLVAMGDLAFDALGGKSLRKPDGKAASITDYRGYLLPDGFRGRRVYAVLHPADLFYDRSKVLPTRLDWLRLRRLRDRTWPLLVPDRTILTYSWDKLPSLLEQARHSSVIACDTEFTYRDGGPDEKGLLTMVGLAWEHNGKVNGVQIQWMHEPAVTKEVRRAFRGFMRVLTKEVPFLFWNAKADLPVIARNLWIPPSDYKGIHDGMLAHHVLWSQMGHTLEFVASLEGGYTKLKHLSKSDPLLYNWGDVIETLHIWNVLWPALQKDAGCLEAYNKKIALLPIIMRREAKGFRVNTAFVEPAIVSYRAKMAQADVLAAAYTGYPINMRSSGSEGQVATFLRAMEGIVVESIDKDSIGVERAKIRPFDPKAEEREFPMQYLEDRVADGAHPLLELRAMVAKDNTILSHFLEPLVEAE